MIKIVQKSVFYMQNQMLISQKTSQKSCSWSKEAFTKENLHIYVAVTKLFDPFCAVLVLYPQALTVTKIFTISG